MVRILSVVLVCCVLLAHVGGASETCVNKFGLQRASPDKIVEQFNYLANEKFFGQDQARDIALSALRRFKPEDLLLVHFVGASGTGKTYLASLVQRSFFKLKQCRPLFEHSEGGGPKALANQMACPFFGAFGLRQDERIDLLAPHSACGVGYADFLNAADQDLAAKHILEHAIEHAFMTRASENEPIILMLDNFSLCKQSCEKLMTKIVSTKRFRLQNQKDVSLRNCVILVTSDLSLEGLRLMPNENKKVALQRVLDAVRTTWGDESLWNDRAHVAPFTPYSDLELVSILDMTIDEVKSEIRSNIFEALQAEKERLNIQGGDIKWTGRFIFTKDDQMKLLDRLHNEVATGQARAFEKIKGRMIAATRRPEPIETKLMQHRPTASESKVPNLLADVFKFLSSNVLNSDVVFKNIEFTQNIVFTVVDDPSLVALEIEDVDGYEPIKTEL